MQYEWFYFELTRVLFLKTKLFRLGGVGMGVDKDRLRQTFLDLVSIPSPSRREREVADWIKKEFETLDMGAVIEEDSVASEIGGNCGNLLVRLPANGKGMNLMLTTHMDTVEDGSKPIMASYDEVTGEFSSDGTTILGGDAKTGVAALIELAYIIKEDNLEHGNLLFIFSVCEEKEALGASHVDENVYRGLDGCITLDHSYPNEIIVGAPSKVALQITVHGTGGHAAFPEQRINAAQVMAKTIGRLPSKRLDEFSTSNIGIMYSGTAINVIPDMAYAEYEIRSHREELLEFHLARTLTSIESSVRDARVYVGKGIGGRGIGADGDEVDTVKKATVEVDVITCYSAYRVSEDSVPVKLLTKGMEACQMDPEMVIAQGGSDANIYNAKGLPSAVLGCGMHGVHGVTERASLEEMCQCVDVMQYAIGQVV